MGYPIKARIYTKIVFEREMFNF